MTETCLVPRREGRLRLLLWLTLLCPASLQAQAVPPPALADAPGTGRVWVEHQVLPGERLEEIAARHGVPAASVQQDLTAQGARLWSGRSVRLRAAIIPAPRQRINYLVRFGDNWNSIAERHGVSRRQLRRWNRQVPRSFEAGTELTLWVEGNPQLQAPTGLGIDLSAASPDRPTVPEGGQSLGQPTRGRLRAGVALPADPAHYTLRRPEFAYGSSHTVRHLQRALERFRRDSDYGGELIVSDMSKPRGGAYGNHHSHQSGRDVDIWLPLAQGVAKGTVPARAADVDWPATWALVRALVRTGQVQYIFLARSRQRHLYRAARAAGVELQTLGDVVQYPRRAQTAVVRHSASHFKHLHVRFRCADGERRCR